ncbi:hypothetical protein SVAN01_08471 [Stagonosporopsis vannaccii]|nr:hypothetical protein SVAN01_08471 [Stagonosporopsis vannaccii]
MPALPLALLALQSTLLAPRALTATGPHTPLTTSHPHLNHTVYAPANLAALPAPVPAIVWANDACGATTPGTDKIDPYVELNREVASWGFVVLGCGAADAALQVLASTGATGDGASNGGSGNGISAAWAHVETGAFGMLGSSCGGAGVYSAAEDARVLSLAVVEVDGAGAGRASRGPSAEESRRKAANATKPVFYFSASAHSSSSVGLDASSSAGSTAAGMLAEGMRAEFAAVAQGVPAWFGRLPGTDAETLKEAGAGKLGRAVRFWAAWMLRGEEGSGGSGFFTEKGAEGEGWTGEGRGLGVLVL